MHETPPIRAVTAKHRPPEPRPEWVPRPFLIRMLAGWRRARLILVSAPSGFGKSTLVAQWMASREESRPFSWITLDRSDNNPQALWTTITVGLNELAENVDGDRLFDLITTENPDIEGTVIPAVADCLATSRTPLLLILDGFDAIADPAALWQLSLFIAVLPPTLQLVLIARSDPALPLTRLRISGDLAELRGGQLAFSPAEADRLVRRVSGIRLRRPELTELVRYTEGWPAGVHLAALSLREAPDPVEFVAGFSGTNRHIVDYLGEEVLRTLPAELCGFLARTSILGRFSAPLCDAVAGTTSAFPLIDRLERANLFLVPLDDNRCWYRYQHVFRDFLRGQLARAEPDIVPTLHLRASSWYAEHGFVDLAIDHALAAGAVDKAVELIARHWLCFAITDRSAQVRGWLKTIGGDRLATDPIAAICAARVAALCGDRHDLQRWLSVAEGFEQDQPLPDGTSSVRSAIALIRSDFGFDGVKSMLEEAETAVELEADSTSPWFAQARLNLGYGRYLSGALEYAILPLEEAAQSRSVVPTVRILALSVLSLVNDELGRVVQAGELARAARAAVEDYGLRDTPEISLAYTALGVAAARASLSDEARRELEHSLRIRWRTVGLSPWPTLNSLLALARLELESGDLGSARVLVSQAWDLLAPIPTDQDYVGSELTDIERRIAELTVTVQSPIEPLTEREETVLRLLMGDLSLRDIGGRLFVSINTVKSHTRAIYRKLGVSSRDEAIQQARKLGILS